MLRFRPMLFLLILTGTPLALAQTSSPPPGAAAPPKKKPKKATKPTPGAPASAAPSESAAAPAAESAPLATSPLPASRSVLPANETGSAPASSAPPVAVAPESHMAGAPETGESITDTNEDPNRRYIFVGLRYRGTIVPQFIENLFVSEGGTIYSNSFGAEVDLRKGGQSTIPWIQYVDYNSGDLLFLQKGQDPANAGYYSDVNSSLKALYVGLDELWSVPLARHLDFEFGFGVGVGYVFGSLQNDWVYQSQSGPLVAGNGLHFAPCPAGSDKGGAPPGLAPGNNSNGCLPASHTNGNPAKVGGYSEPNWFNGGGVPAFFPHVSVPQIGLRYKPIKQLETRLQVGFSLTGFWFGLSADYGLEKTNDTSHHEGLRARGWNDTL